MLQKLPRSLRRRRFRQNINIPHRYRHAAKVCVTYCASGVKLRSALRANIMEWVLTNQVLRLVRKCTRKEGQACVGAFGNNEGSPRNLVWEPLHYRFIGSNVIKLAFSAVPFAGEESSFSLVGSHLKGEFKSNYLNSSDLSCADYVEPTCPSLHFVWIWHAFKHIAATLTPLVALSRYRTLGQSLANQATRHLSLLRAVGFFVLSRARCCLCGPARCQ